MELFINAEKYYNGLITNRKIKLNKNYISIKRLNCRAIKC